MTASTRLFPYESIRNYAWVSSKVAHVTRVTDLSWKHHQAVARLMPKEQKHWLRKAQPREGAHENTRPQGRAEQWAGRVRHETMISRRFLMG